MQYQYPPTINTINDGNILSAAASLPNNSVQVIQNFGQKFTISLKKADRNESENIPLTYYQENSETFINCREESSNNNNNTSFNRFDNEDLTIKLTRTQNSSTTCKSQSVTVPIESLMNSECFNEKGLEDLECLQDSHNYINIANIDEVNTARNNQQQLSAAFAESNPQPLNKVQTAINSLNHIQLSSFRNIQEQECVSGCAYLQIQNNDKFCQYLKNSDVNCHVPQNKQIGEEVAVQASQFSNIEKISSNSINNIYSTSTKEITFRPLNFQQSQFCNYEIYMPIQTGCMGIHETDKTFHEKDNEPAHRVQDKFGITSQDSDAPNSPIREPRSLIQCHYHQEQFAPMIIMEEQTHHEQSNFSYMAYWNGSSSDTPNSNECIPSSENDNFTSSSSTSQSSKLKIEECGPEAECKKEEMNEENSSVHSCNSHQTSSQIEKSGASQENQMEEEGEDETLKKDNFIKRIIDSSSSCCSSQDEYWNKFTESDDDYLLKVYEKIDKNNVNKNILSSFLSYILEKGDDIVVECLDSKQKELNTIRKELKNFTRNKKLNNNTINSFFNSKRYSEQFQYYLKFYAIDYFSKSKVKDKNSHYICVAFFLRCFYNSQMRENIVIYNKSKYFKSISKKRYVPVLQSDEKSTIQTTEAN